MSTKWIKSDDKVLIVAGNDKGKIGTVLARKQERILVQGVNVRKKHMKRKSENSKSEIVSIELPVHISNVALCDADGEKIKLKVKMSAEGSKELYYTKGGKEVVYRTVRKGKKKS
ncbi:MAG: 50S ribosomal protein L24 [Simkaniaceae bacterium]|nr:50S ribosomal protein L24 [Simkaniaceae bacterium]